MQDAFYSTLNKHNTQVTISFLLEKSENLFKCLFLLLYAIIYAIYVEFFAIAKKKQKKTLLKYFKYI